MNQSLKIYVVSDSIGETAERVVFATLRQFPNLNARDIKKFPFINNEEDLKELLEDALVEKAILITTLVDEKLNRLVRQFVKANDLEHIDYLSPLMNIISDKTGETPISESGALHRLDEDYFNRMSAIEFAVKYDDGKSPKGFLKSDIVLLGISRTSKTPLSMYLANKGYKIANIPLVPEVNIPDEVFRNKNLKVFGLTASPTYILNIRTERVKVLGLHGPTDYNSVDRIKEELMYAEEIFAKLNATVINTEFKSIEESAFYIEKFL